ncbi:unnamed protein product [Rotaria sp. Silwood2]|nr:unnamed protein product [Rotaria sp. Silwood2]
MKAAGVFKSLESQERPAWLSDYEKELDIAIASLQKPSGSKWQVMRSLGLNPTNKEIADLIAEVDKNGNQNLDFQEFVAFMNKHWNEGDQEAELREAFRLFDRDNSGYITINELKEVMLNMGEKLNQEELEDMMREADVNKDGKLDYEGNLILLLSFNLRSNDVINFLL